MSCEVSIIVPCYKQAQYLDEALQSVLDQTYSDWECIVVNDGSPDLTEKTVKKWLNKDARFKYAYQQNRGLSSARNLGISMATGNFILPLDADDKIARDYVELSLAAFKEEPSYKVVYCKAEKFGSQRGEWKMQPFSLYNLSRKNMIFCSAFFRKKDWEQVGGFDTNMVHGFEDWDFWISLLKDGGEVKRLETIGFYYRIKERSMVKEIRGDKERRIFEYLSVKHADFFVQYFGSFHALDREVANLQQAYYKQLKSEKFVIDLFGKTFLGFSIFGKYK